MKAASDPLEKLKIISDFLKNRRANCNFTCVKNKARFVSQAKMGTRKGAQSKQNENSENSKKPGPFNRLKRSFKDLVDSASSSKKPKRDTQNNGRKKDSKADSKKKSKKSLRGAATRSSESSNSPEDQPVLRSEVPAEPENKAEKEGDFLALDGDFSDVADSIRTTFQEYEKDLENNSSFYGTGDMLSDADHSDDDDDNDHEFPWMKRFQTSKYKNIPDRLTAEIRQFSKYVSPTEAEVAQRIEVVDTIKKLIQRKWPQHGVDAFIFGSFATNLYLPGSDIDMVIISKSRNFWQVKSSLYQLSAALRSSGIGSQIEVISKARVPIVKFKDTKYGIPIDISFERLNGLEAVKTINSWLEVYPSIRELALVIKRYLAKRRLNEVHTGGLGGFAIICLIVSFLRCHPRIASKDIKPEDNLGVLLIEFFEFYGLNFNYDDLFLDPTSSRYTKKTSSPDLVEPREEHMMKLVIQDPNDSTNNLSRGSFNIRGIKKAFSGGFNILTAKCYELHSAGPKKSKGVSLLGSIIDIKDKSRSFQTKMFAVDVNAKLGGVIETQGNGSRPSISSTILTGGESDSDELQSSVFGHMRTSSDSEEENSGLGELDQSSEEEDEDENEIEEVHKAKHSVSVSTSSNSRKSAGKQEGASKEQDTMNGSVQFRSRINPLEEIDSKSETVTTKKDWNSDDEDDSKIKQTSIDKERRRQYWLSKGAALKPETQYDLE